MNWTGQEFGIRCRFKGRYTAGGGYTSNVFCFVYLSILAITSLYDGKELVSGLVDGVICINS